MLLVLLGRSEWPERVLRPPLTSVDAKKSRAHKRQDSGPFGVLYHNVRKDNKPPELAGDLSTQYKTVTTPSYLEIENTLLTGKRPLGKQTTSPQTVTIIEEKVALADTPNASRLGTLRRRRTTRSWMARHREAKFSKRQQTPKLKPDAKKTTKIDYVFPIERKTSFRYVPPRSPRLIFRSQRDIDNYFAVDDIPACVKSLLPPMMKTFKFRRLERVEPLLEMVSRVLGVSSGPMLTPAGSGGAPASLDQVPLSTHIARSDSPYGSLLSTFDKHSLFLWSVYATYRKAVFGAKSKLPEKLEQVLPSEAQRLSAKDRCRIETVLLLEVLLRRTVAAKFDFRLRQNDNYGRKTTPETCSSISHTSLFTHSSTLFTYTNHASLELSWDTD